MANMTSEDVGLTVAFSVIVLINLLGNGLVCLVALRYRGMRAPLNYLLVNLAVSDMLVALAITSQYVIKWTFQHPNSSAGDYVCMFITGGIFIWVGQAASTFTLVAVAIERYLAVVRPLGKRRNTRQMITVITASWLFALVSDLPLFFVLRHQDGVNHCIERWQANKNLAKAYTIACFIVFGAIPVGSMAFFYIKLLSQLWKFVIRSTPLISEQARIRARLKVTKMVLAVVSIIYALCRLPNLVLYMLSHFKPELYGYASFPYVTSVVLVGLNSAMNPFIYALYSTNFRKHVRLALCCRAYRPSDYFGGR